MSFYTAFSIIRRITEAPKRAFELQEQIERQKLRRNMQVIRFCEIAVESAELIETTFSPKTFFGRYDDLEQCISDIEASRVRTQAIASLLWDLKKFIRRKTKYTKEFIDRCPEDRLQEMLRYRDKMTDKSYAYLLYWIDALKEE